MLDIDSKKIISVATAPKIKFLTNNDNVSAAFTRPETTVVTYKKQFNASAIAVHKNKKPVDNYPIHGNSLSTERYEV